MKNSLLKVGKILRKSEQQLIKGGNSNCDYYARINLCFADNDPYCKPCNQIGNYPGAASCMNLDNGCFEL
ncbi:hypothetical protein F7018_18065 [Tenacibaculum aiptasiae]|uniref:Uncharacterized protein n=1 Tax=Tenacibaculum aiptasiae TaxID=426481 RepID=A0A7J5A501_9FLAO|nr:hypothetical protein [Tenacibaculum aiptasiae]KAB1151715.1 hypothetical protein F7018_18065 [Tenacibaculum aiptasiae]